MKQVHSQIGRFLYNNAAQLSIKDIGEAEIENEHGDKSTVNVWKKGGVIMTNTANKQFSITNNYNKMKKFLLTVGLFCSVTIMLSAEAINDKDFEQFFIGF